MNPEVQQRAARIKLLLMDCDGVLTDGRIWAFDDGEEQKGFHTRDGLGIAVADASPDTREHAHYVTELAGGYGAVREVVELILKAQDRWADLIRVYLR